MSRLNASMGGDAHVSSCLCSPSCKDMRTPKRMFTRTQPGQRSNLRLSISRMRGANSSTSRLVYGSVAVTQTDHLRLGEVQLKTEGEPAIQSRNQFTSSKKVEGGEGLKRRGDEESPGQVRVR